jgi:hypothetical protein
MCQTIESKNKTLVLEAFDALFHKRDYDELSANYIENPVEDPPLQKVIVQN